MQRSNAYKDIRDWIPPRKCGSAYDLNDEEEVDTEEGPFDALFDELVDFLDIVEECGKGDRIDQVRTELGNWLTQMKRTSNSSTELKST